MAPVEAPIPPACCCAIPPLAASSWNPCFPFGPHGFHLQKIMQNRHSNTSAATIYPTMAPAEVPLPLVVIAADASVHSSPIRVDCTFVKCVASVSSYPISSSAVVL